MTICSSEGINMVDCVQLTQGGIYANRAEIVTSGQGFSIL